MNLFSSLAGVVTVSIMGANLAATLGSLNSNYKTHSAMS